MKIPKSSKKSLTFAVFATIMNEQIRGVAKFGIALGSGPRGRGFESRHSDQNPQIFVQEAQISEDFFFFVALLFVRYADNRFFEKI